MSFAFFHRHTLTGQHALVNKGSAFHHRAVHRDNATGANHHHIPYPDILHGDLGLNAISKHSGGFGAQIHQLPDGVAGFSLCPGLQKFTQGHQGQNHGSRFKIQAVTIAFHRSGIAPGHGIGHQKQNCHAIDQRCGRSHRDQRIHIGGSMPQRPESPNIVDSVQINHGQS